VLLDAIRKLSLNDLVIVSPDVGGLTRARAIAKRLDASLAVIDKRRTGKNETEILNVVGDVEGKDVLILDDIIDTAGTLAKTVDALRAPGAKRILASCVHGVLSGPAIQRIEASPLEQVLITNTTPVEEKLQKSAKLRAFSVAPLLGEAIRRIHENSSVSSLFV
jgi:ribose-phosphate pyrophosphokinase